MASENCGTLMHILAVANKDKAELKAIFDRNGIMWKEHGEYISGGNHLTGEIVAPDHPDLTSYIEILLEPEKPRHVAPGSPISPGAKGRGGA